LTVLLLLALCLNISTLWSAAAIKNGKSITAGYFCAIVSSGSMEPTISVNDLLLLQGSDVYQAEDIITYVSAQGAMVTHRIKECSAHGYVTQGDANNIPDEKISKQRILGRVVFVLPGFGSIIDGITSSVGIASLGCISLLVWLLQRIGRNQNEDTQDEAEGSHNRAEV
jgi:signal peptidase I, archaeal type